MAQDEMFSGPISESIPTSNTGYASRRSRANSSASFTYYDEDQQQDSDSWQEEEAVITEEPYEEDFTGEQNGYTELGDDLEAATGPLLGRRQSSRSRQSGGSKGSCASAEDPLLKRHNSTGSATSNFSSRGLHGRLSQKVYIQSEDMSIVIAGFQTSFVGYLLYIALCVCTAGMGYLLFRWLPRWRLRLCGTTTPLSECTWVVVEVSGGCCILYVPATHKCRVNGVKLQFKT